MFLYTAKMFLPKWLWAYPEFKQAIHYSKKKTLGAIIMSQWKIRAGQMTVLICNVSLVELKNNIQQIRNMENYIAVKNGKMEKFNAKWLRKSDSVNEEASTSLPEYISE